MTVATNDVTAVDHIYYLDDGRVICFVLFLIRFFFYAVEIVNIITTVRH